MDKPRDTLSDWEYFSCKYSALALYIFGSAGIIGLFVDWKKALVLLSLATLALLATPFRWFSVQIALAMVVTWSTLAFLVTRKFLALLPIGLALVILIPLFWYDGTRLTRSEPKRALVWEPRKYSVRELIWDLSFGLLVFGMFRLLLRASATGLL